MRHQSLLIALLGNWLGLTAGFAAVLLLFAERDVAHLVDDVFILSTVSAIWNVWTYDYVLKHRKNPKDRRGAV